MRSDQVRHVVNRLETVELGVLVDHHVNTLTRNGRLALQVFQNTAGEPRLLDGVGFHQIDLVFDRNAPCASEVLCHEVDVSAFDDEVAAVVHARDCLQ